MRFSTRKRLAAALSILILSPLIPFAVLSLAFRAMADAIDWLFDGRWLARSLQEQTERVERAFRVDPDTEYAEWKARQRSKILSKKGELTCP